MRMLPIEQDPLESMKDIIDALQRHRAGIERALTYGGGGHTFDYVAARVLSGDCDIYILPNSIIIAEIGEQTNFSVYHGFIAAGNLEEILSFDEQFQHEARIRGCKKVSIAGRRGWLKPMKSIGWDEAICIMYKDVKDEQD